MQVILDMREKELEERQMEMAKVLAALNAQQEKLQSIILSEEQNKEKMEALYNGESLDVIQIESHRQYGIKLAVDEQNQRRVIANTESILRVKQNEVKEAHQKVEILKKLKEKQEKEYYQEFLHAEVKEIDDITSARYRFQ